MKFLPIPSGFTNFTVSHSRLQWVIPLTKNRIRRIAIPAAWLLTGNGVWYLSGIGAFLNRWTIILVIGTAQILGDRALW
jgi:hypothetical protein